MTTKIILLLITFFALFGNVSAHNFNEETMKYILSNPESTWTDFQSHISSFDDEELEEKLENTDIRISTILSMPGKKYVMIYANENRDFSYTDIHNLVDDDPMLGEIGSELIYSFLSRQIQGSSPYSISLDYFLRFIYIGLEHILGGIDHILFIFSLILVLPRRTRILAIITTFTIAHSITIVLGGMQIVSLPSIVVESMILFSIGLMALYSVFQKVGESQKFLPEFILIFTLGLFHGLGFAGFFSEILSSSNNVIFPIIGFNIGVELGQIFVITIALTALYFIYKFFPKQKEYIKNTLSVCLIFVSIFWLVRMLVGV